jgi:hypothetical protein
MRVIIPTTSTLYSMRTLAMVGDDMHNVGALFEGLYRLTFGHTANRTRNVDFPLNIGTLTTNYRLFM